jgi:outer membrane protein assembly factor BamA
LDANKIFIARIQLILQLLLAIRGFIYCFVLFAVSAKPAFVNAQAIRLNLSSNPLNVKYSALGDSLQHMNTLERIRNQYLANGYIAFSVDSIVWKNRELNAFLFIGRQYRIGAVNIVRDSFAQNYQSIKSKYLFTFYDTANVYKMAEEILTSSENNGFPFCRVNVITQVREDKIIYELSIERGPYFAFDSMHIDGDAVVKKSFLEAYTGLKNGAPYNEALYRKAHDKLNQLPFLYSERPPELAFINGGKAKPYLYLKKKKSDQVNGIVGLAPSTTGSGPTATQNVVLTGEFLLRLNNLFRSAKMLSINWRSFRARSQELKTAFSYPYILSRPIGADVALDFVKFDTLYTTLSRQVGLQYYTSGINGIKAFYQVSTTNLNSVDTNIIRNSRAFPAINAVEIKQYGLMANFNLLDYRFNPRSGWLIDAYASVGNKQILRDNTISEVKFGSSMYTLYDSNTLKTTQYQLKMKVDKFFRTGMKTTFKVGVYMAQTVAPRIYFNEVLREGGINSLKGFNEQSIFATNFNMLELEYRYLFGINSYFKAFWNGAYYEDKSYGRTQYVYDKPWGFGVGANIETGAGILSIMYALGKEKSNRFDLRTGKIHFGISSYF